MTNTVTCVNHPERAAVEYCEVCGDPLCAYCLYYTSDGQRLCKRHADKAAASGAFIRAPGTYADGLIDSQLSATRVQPSLPAAYQGDAIDVLALIGLLFGVVSIMLCIPGGCCLVGPIGMILSIVALVGAKDARDPVRTRTMASVGALLSAVWIVVLTACIIAYFGQTQTILHTLNFNNLPVTVIAPQFNQQPAPPPTATPTVQAPGR